MNFSNEARFTAPSCKMDQNEPGNRTKMAHSARMVRERAEWAKMEPEVPLQFRAGPEESTPVHSFLDEEVFERPLGRPDQPPPWTKSESERPRIAPPRALTSPPARPSSPSPASPQVGST